MSNAFQKYGAGTLISVALHCIVVGALLWGWAGEVEPQKIERPNYVQAKLVSLEQKSQATAKPIKKNQPNKIDLVKKRQAAEEQKKAKEQKRIMEVKRQKEKKAREEKVRLAKAKKDKAEKEKAKKEADRKAQEKAQRDARQQEQLRAEQEAINQALEAAEQRLAEQAYEEEAESYRSAIYNRIEQNWSRPPSARNGMFCELRIGLVPTGRVVSVNVVKSSGSVVFDRSAEQAVKKAEQFPELKEMKPEVFERYYRELTLVFRPQDLRL